ncbi:MAG: hypothetical protein JXA95_09520 [Spirochaetales bacterium]|nr:hypothetical protein [Spirochaetales bacterium]
MKRFLSLLLLLGGALLFCQTESLMTKVRDLTGLEENHFLIQGFGSIDRADYLPRQYRSLANDPVDIPLRKGITALSPLTLIRILNRAGLREEDRILIVGEEASYCAAALSRAGMEVYLIDPTADASSAYSLMKDVNNLNSWISMAPFDFIFCLNAREEIPPALIKQLSLKGILVSPLISQDSQQSWCRVENTPSGPTFSLMESASLFPLF